MAKTGNAPLPYKKTDETPNLGVVDQSDDIRGGMGLEGLAEPGEVRARRRHADHRGLDRDDPAEYGVTQRHHRREPVAALRARVDPARQVRRSQEPARLRLRRQRPAGLLQPGPGAERRRRRMPGGPLAAFFGGGAANAGLGQNVTPNVNRLQIQPLDGPTRRPSRRPAGRRPARWRRCGRWRAQFGITFDDCRPRVALSFSPNANDLLLSGTLAGGQALTGKARAGRRLARQGPRRDVRDPPVLAVADPGHLQPGLQRDDELERPGRRKDCRGANDAAVGQQISQGIWRSSTWRCCDLIGRSDELRSI